MKHKYQFLTPYMRRVLKKKLDAAAIEYEEIDDIEIIESYGIDYVPALDINGLILNFSAAAQWINNYKGGN